MSNLGTLENEEARRDGEAGLRADQELAAERLRQAEFNEQYARARAQVEGGEWHTRWMQARMERVAAENAVDAAAEGATP